MGVGAHRATAVPGRAQRERHRSTRLRCRAHPRRAGYPAGLRRPRGGAIDAAAGPVVLVAHSMGWIAASTAAEQRPEKIRRTVYVAAFMLPDGQALFGFTQSTPEFATSKTPQYLEVDEAGSVSRIKPEGIGPLFVNDGNEADVQYVRAHAHADYLAPQRHSDLHQRRAVRVGCPHLRPDAAGPDGSGRRATQDERTGPRRRGPITGYRPQPVSNPAARARRAAAGTRLTRLRTQEESRP